MIAALLFLLSAAISLSVLNVAGTLFFYQSFTPEVVYAGCGLGFQHPGVIPEPLERFLLAQQSSFDCSLLDSAAPLQPPGLFARLQLYLSYSVAFLWSPPILAHWNLWPLVAMLAGAYGAGLFVLYALLHGGARPPPKRCPYTATSSMRPRISGLRHLNAPMSTKAIVTTRPQTCAASSSQDRSAVSSARFNASCADAPPSAT